MTEKVSRVYTIVHFQDSSSGQRLYLVGTEAVLHNKALAEMRDALTNPKNAAQRNKIAAALQSGAPIVDPTSGRILTKRGRWRGGNAGGVLLIGRPALFGGRVERNEAPLQAIAREVVEEMRLPLALIEHDAEARLQLEDCFDHWCDLERPGGRPSAPIVERYYALDLDRVQASSNMALREAFVPANLFLAFAPQVVSDLRDSDAPADTLEKVALQVLDADAFVESLGGPPCAEDLQRIRAEAERFGRLLCDAVGVTGVPDAFVGQVVDFQKQRRIPNHVAAARTFIKFNA